MPVIKLADQIIKLVDKPYTKKYLVVKKGGYTGYVNLSDRKPDKGKTLKVGNLYPGMGKVTYKLKHTRTTDSKHQPNFGAKEVNTFTPIGVPWAKSFSFHGKSSTGGTTGEQWFNWYSDPVLNGTYDIKISGLPKKMLGIVIPDFDGTVTYEKINFVNGVAKFQQKQYPGGSVHIFPEAGTWIYDIEITPS